MAGISGRGLRHRDRQNMPDLPVIVITALVNKTVRPPAFMDGAKEVVR
ncbi:hypothetical protein [Methylobacterium sp. Leaf86]|nr:hypothetical protein [Methylobacterium sp. Leaf86]